MGKDSGRRGRREGMKVDEEGVVGGVVRRE